MNKEWVHLARYRPEYINGVNLFIDFAYTNGKSEGSQIMCPCSKCCNRYWSTRNVVFDHLIVHGFQEGYTTWINHGEELRLNIQRAKNENNQEPNQSDMFIETRTTNGISLDNDTQRTIDHLKGLVDNDGKSHDEAFHEVFGKERSGRVRCGGRTLTPTLLKKNQEMATMTKMHAMEMASIKEDMEKKLEERDRDMKRKLEETQKYFKSMLKSVLTQMNPSLDVDAIDAMMPLTPRDANSDFNSSTAMHIPNNEDNNDIHEGDDSDDDDDDDNDDDEIDEGDVDGDEGDVDGDEMDHEENDGALN